jgi:hypothetical protein
LHSDAAKGSYGNEELKRFWKLTERAGMVLSASNSELDDRVGLRSGFFTAVVRDRRSPKLQNYLKVLSSIIEVANERLADVEDGRRVLDLLFFRIETRTG